MKVHTHRVRYHEADAQGFLFNARYLEIADVALTEYLRTLGWGWTALVAGGTDLSVVSASLTFARPARFDDLLDVDVSCLRVGTSSLTLAMSFARDDEPVASVELTYVNVDVAAGSSRPLPPEVADRLRAEVGSADQGAG